MALTTRTLTNSADGPLVYPDGAIIADGTEIWFELVDADHEPTYAIDATTGELILSQASCVATSGIFSIGLWPTDRGTSCMYRMSIPTIPEFGYLFSTIPTGISGTMSFADFLALADAGTTWTALIGTLVPPGGLTNQVLAKQSDTDGHTHWIDVPALDTNNLNGWPFDFYSSELETVVASIGSAVSTLVITSPQVLAASLIIPVNISIEIKQGGIITVPTGETLTINGSLDAGMYQIFAGDGSVVLANVPTVYPEWWGGDIQAAITSGASIITGSIGEVYTSASAISMTDGTTLNLNGSTLRFTGTTEIQCLLTGNDCTVYNGTVENTNTGTATNGSYQCPIVVGNYATGVGCSNVNLHDLTISTDFSNGNGILVTGDSRNVKIENIHYPDSSTIGRPILLHWGGDDAPTAGTTHPHNIDIKNITIGAMTNSSSDTAAIFISASYNVTVDNVIVDSMTVGTCVYVFCGDYGFAYGSAYEQVNGSIGVTVSNVIGKSVPQVVDIYHMDKLGSTVVWPSSITFENCQGTSPDGLDTGIGVSRVSGLAINNCSLNDFVQGIYVGSYADNITIDGNRVNGSATYGIRTISEGSASKIRVTNNQVTGSGYHGISCESGALCYGYTITGNHVKDSNTTHGAYRDINTTLIGDVLIANNTFDSADVYNSIRVNSGCVNVKIRDNNSITCSTSAWLDALVAHGPVYSLGAATDFLMVTEFANNSAPAVVPANGIKSGQLIVPAYLATKHLSSTNLNVAYYGYPPAAGTWNVGDTVYNSAPTVTSAKGWVCVTAGTPGSWVPFGDSSYVTPEMFGIVDGVNDEVQIQAAFDTGNPVVFANKTYNIEAPILLNSTEFVDNYIMTGGGATTKLVAKGLTSGYMFYVNRQVELVSGEIVPVTDALNHPRFIVRDMTIDGIDPTTTAVSFCAIHRGGVRLDNVTLNGLQNGIVTSGYCDENSHNLVYWIQPSAWADMTGIAAGTRCKYNGNIYLTTAGGTKGSTPPTHTTGSVSDGGVTWTYLYAQGYFYDQTSAGDGLLSNQFFTTNNPGYRLYKNNGATFNSLNGGKHLFTDCYGIAINGCHTEFPDTGLSTVSGFEFRNSNAAFTGCNLYSAAGTDTGPDYGAIRINDDITKDHGSNLTLTNVPFLSYLKDSNPSIADIRAVTDCWHKATTITMIGCYRSQYTLVENPTGNYSIDTLAGKFCPILVSDNNKAGDVGRSPIVGQASITRWDATITDSTGLGIYAEPLSGDAVTLRALVAPVLTTDGDDTIVPSNLASGTYYYTSQVYQYGYFGRSLPTDEVTVVHITGKAPKLVITDCTPGTLVRLARTTVEGDYGYNATPYSYYVDIPVQSAGVITLYDTNQTVNQWRGWNATGTGTTAIYGTATSTVAGTAGITGTDRYGSDHPEGAVIANPGDRYYRTNGAVYKKSTGAYNTGWVEIADVSTAQTLTNKTLTSPVLNGISDLTISGQLTTGNRTRHLVMAADVRGAPAATPALEAVGTAPVMVFAATGTEYAYFQWEVPSDWVAGTNVTVEIDWCPWSASMGAGDAVKWDVVYGCRAEGEAVNGSLTTATVTKTGTAITQYVTTHSPTTIAYNDATNPLTHEDHVFFRVSRDTGVASDFAGTAGVFAFELIYTSNGIPEG